ncbi:uncharacterized protein LOC105690232 [Athalia rosae]|uniref:uncharacterized protein LOC105690232 n=1 Tax=Athalia rosae TaxID=37344 RepID=UPI00203383FF|nr:uncharacterized protein LOC105690232 [Athalia rosae]
MTSKATFLKFVFGVIFYICTCVLCLSIRQNYLTISNLRLKNGTSVVKCKPFHKVISQFVQKNTVPLDASIQELDYQYPRGQIIDSEKVLHLQSISEACTHYNISSVLVKRHYLYSPKNTTLYCWTRKAASTSFVKLISDMWDRRVTKDYDKEIDILSPKTIEELKNLISNDGVFKFMVVRHPFERIVSSYRYCYTTIYFD